MLCSRSSSTERQIQRQSSWECLQVPGASILTGGGVEDVDVGVDVGVIGAGHLDEGRGGEDQDVGAGRVLRGAQLGRLHVEGGAAAEHRACRHGV